MSLQPILIFLLVAFRLARAWWGQLTLCGVGSPDRLAGGLLLAIAVTTIPTRQLLMPAINRATDAGNKRRFQWLHGLSVLITLAHIGVAGWLLTRFL